MPIGYRQTATSMIKILDNTIATTRHVTYCIFSRRIL